MSADRRVSMEGSVAPVFCMSDNNPNVDLQKDVQKVTDDNGQAASTFTDNFVCNHSNILATDPVMHDSQMIAAYYPSKY